MTQLDKDFLLNESKVFCMFPWIHLFVTPSGHAHPCCSHSGHQAVGNVKGSSMKEVFNSPEMKNLRVDMLNNRPNKICNLCYELESTTGHNLRTYGIQTFKKHFDKAVTGTREDGTVDTFELKYLDVRFNNICNFKCRTCGGEYSSQWAIEDYQKKKKNGHTIDKKTTFTILNADSTGNLLEETLSQLPHVDMVYFAGGEPMLSEEHYRILEEIIKLNRPEILLRYNTNSSTLKFRDKDILQLWKFFNKIEVSSSLDHYGEKAEYIRHGTNWGEVETNLNIFRNLSNVEFQINTVLSNLNFVTIVEFYEYLINKGFYKSTDHYHFLVTTPSPSYFSSTSLTQPLKDIGKSKIDAYSNAYKGKIFSLDNNLTAALNHTTGSDTWEANKENFKRIIKEIDEVRGENFEKVFPELISLMD